MLQQRHCREEKAPSLLTAVVMDGHAKCSYSRLCQLYANTIDQSSDYKRYSNNLCSFKNPSCHLPGYVDSKTLFQQNPSVLDWGCRLMQVVVYNGHKTEHTCLCLYLCCVDVFAV